jgi:Polyketide cyclase / dehydrase and lipid transport
MSKKRHVIDLHATSSAPPEAVWALLSDAPTWASWSAFTTSGIETPGPDDPNGIDAVRYFGRGKRVTRERVVAFDAPKHFAYVLLSGLKGVYDYRADVVLVPAAGGGTEITWHSEFRGAPGTGWITRIVLGRFIAQVAKDLAVHAATPTHAG